MLFLDFIKQFFPEKGFFPEGYLYLNPDVAERGEDPWRHWVLHGQKEGRPDGKTPPEDFFAEGYLYLNPGVARRGIDPWRHYIKYGLKEGRPDGKTPPKSFFKEGYLYLNPDVAERGEDPWRHWVLHGQKEGRPDGKTPPEDFFAEGYLYLNPGVARRGINPWRHYIKYGLKEGRPDGKTSPKSFFPEGYLYLNPDVAERGEDPWRHWVLHGQKEGRPDGKTPPEDFFAEGYLYLNPDVAERGEDPWRHWVLHGQKEGRPDGKTPPESFFKEGYLYLNPDVAKAGRDAWQHWVLNGIREGRRGGIAPPNFFKEGYLYLNPDVAERGEDPWRHWVLKGSKKGDNADNLKKQVLFTGFVFDGYHGSVMHIMEMAQYFVSNGYSVDIASVCIRDEIKELLSYQNIRLHSALTFPVEDKVYDFVFSYHWPIFPFLLKRGLKYKKLVLGCLSGFETMETPLPFIDNACFLQVHSESLKDDLIKSYSIPADKIAVFENWLPDIYYQYPKKQKDKNLKLSRLAVISNHPPLEIRSLPDFMSGVRIEFWGRGMENYGLITPEILKKYDAIITIGKTVQYALGMGIPVYNYDHFGGSGWISPENFDIEAKHNFSGRSNSRKILSQEIAQELKEGFPKAIEVAEELRRKIAGRCLLSIRMSQLLEMIDKSPISPTIDSKRDGLLMAYADSMVRWVYSRDYRNRKFELKNKTINRIIQKILSKNNNLNETTIKSLEKIIDNNSSSLSSSFLNYSNKELRSVSLFAVIAVKDEERYLPGFFNHLRDYVDGFVVLDDGSIDETPNIIKKESKVISVMTNPPHGPEDWDEKGNRIRLLNEARRLGGEVVLFCDADERFEVGFLRELRGLAQDCLEDRELVYGVKLCELWDSPDQWRCDGIWNQKSKYVLFSLNDNMTFDMTMNQKHHIPYFHDGINKRKLLGFRDYHLKMINDEDRKKRRNLYKRLDPNNEMQKIGYDYLTDCGGISLSSIRGREYDLRTVPSK